MLPLDTHSDDRLLGLLAGGSKTAFETLYHRYWSLLYTTAYKHLKDSEQCKEIVNDILLDLWERRETVQIGNLPLYLKKAVRFRVINYVNRQRPPAFFQLFDGIAASPYAAESIVLEKDTLELITLWVQALPQKRRQIFIRHFMDNLSTREVAEELDISHKTAQNQAALALQYLRTKLAQLLEVLLTITAASILFPG